MLAAPPTSYDDVPYDMLAHPESHPDRLATMATLLGFAPPPVERCRVLELGCAAGGNLIPMALALPESTFVGIDYSPRQVEQGNEILAALGLKNIELQPRDLLDVPDDFGPFDYVISHGVYSWIPPRVQDKLLSICKHSLAPGGLAFVSYNAFPGWHLRGMVRELMAYHVRAETAPDRRAAAARQLLGWLAEHSKPETAYGRFLRTEHAMLKDKADSYLLHDHLEENNHPAFFHEFMRRAAAHGLAYLGEVDLWTMLPANFGPEAERVLQPLSADVVRLEQYMDFLRMRSFRETLLCHPEAKPTPSLRAERLEGMAVAAPLEVKQRDGETVTFEGRKGTTLVSREPLPRDALLHLAAVWPEAVPLEELLLRAKPDATDADRLYLQQYLLKLTAMSGTIMVELHVRPPRLIHAISERPTASPLTRLQARRGRIVTTLRHQTLVVEEDQRELLTLLDGQHERTELQRTVPDCDTRLKELARHALLMA